MCNNCGLVQRTSPSRQNKMKTRQYILLIFTTLLLFNCTLRHVTKQSQVTSVVTLCDHFNGSLSKADIISKPYLTISNNKLEWKIINYEMTYIKNGTLYNYTLTNASFSKESIAGLDSVKQKSKIFIDNIKAVNKLGDTTLLNPIIIKVKD